MAFRQNAVPLHVAEACLSPVFTFHRFTLPRGVLAQDVNVEVSSHRMTQRERERSVMNIDRKMDRQISRMDRDTLTRTSETEMDRHPDT